MVYISYNDLIKRVNALVTDNSVMTFKCYATAYDFPEITSLKELVDILKKFAECEGAPIKVGI